MTWRWLALGFWGLAFIGARADAKDTPSNAPFVIRTLDDVLNILTSPEPQYQGVADLINNSNSYFPIIYRIAEHEDPYGNAYARLDAWAEEKLKTYGAQVARGETYRQAYYNQALAEPREDPTIRAVSKEYLGILADLRGDPRSGTTPPLYTHPDAQRVTGELLKFTTTPEDMIRNPDIYRRSLNQGTFRRMEQPDYTKPSPNEFSARLRDIKARLERMQVETYRNFLIDKAKTVGVSIAPNREAANLYQVDRTQILPITAAEIAQLPFEVTPGDYGYTHFNVRKKNAEGEETIYQLGHSEKKGHWHPYSAIHSTASLVGEEEFLGKLETDFLKGQSNAEDLHLALLKKYLKLSSALRRDLDRATQARDLPKIANQGLAKLSEFNQRPNAAEFHWTHSHGLAEYRGESKSYNRLIDGIIWEGRGRSVELGADYWQLRDETAARQGKGQVKVELIAASPTLAGNAKALSIRSMDWIGGLFTSLKHMAFPDDLWRHVRNDGVIRNTTAKETKRREKELLYDIARMSPRGGASEFLMPSSGGLSGLTGEVVKQSEDAKAGDIAIKNRIPARSGGARHYLLTPRDHLASHVEIYDEKGNVVSRNLWQLRRDPVTGHHWVDFLSAAQAPKSVTAEATFVRSSAPEASLEAKELLLIKDLEKFGQLTEEVRGYGFTKLADALADLGEQAREKHTSLSIEEVRKAFTYSGLYTMGKGSGPRLRHTATDFELEDFRGFLKGGEFCGQCDSGNEFFATFLNRYFEGEPRVYISTESVFRTSAGAGIIRASDGHRVTDIRVDGKLVYVADATPVKEVTLKRERQEKEKEEKKKAEAERERVRVQEKLSTSESVETLRTYHTDLLTARDRLTEGLDLKAHGVPTASLRAAMNLSNPLGQALIMSQHLNQFLGKPPTRASLDELARGVGMNDPAGRSLDEIMGYISAQSNDVILPSLKTFDEASARQPGMLKKMPQLASAHMRQRVRALANVLSQTTAAVYDTSAAAYAASTRVVDAETLKCQRLVNQTQTP